MQDLYWQFLDAGYTPELFWKSTLGEIQDLLLAYEDKLKLRAKERELIFKENTIVMWNGVLQMGNVLQKSLARHPSSIQLTPLADYYPDLFKEEAEKNEERPPRQEAELAMRQANMRAFIAQHNARRRKGNGDGSRHDPSEAEGAVSS